MLRRDVKRWESVRARDSSGCDTGAGRFRSICGRRRQGGTTIVESITVLAIVGLLASLAYPSLVQHWRRTRRMDAIVAVARVQQAQERFRGEKPAYADGFITQDGQPGGALLRMADTAEVGRLSELRSTDGHYLLRVTAADSRGFTVTAVARNGQSDDRLCTTMWMMVDGDAVTHSSSASGSSADSEARHRCWQR